MKMYLGILHLLVFVCAFIMNVLACPPEEDFYPCKSPNLKDRILYCQWLKASDNILKPIQATVKCKKAITILIIRSSTFNYIPNSTFVNTKFQEIFFYDTNIMDLSNIGTAFQGLENHLTRFYADHYSKAFPWSVQWKQLNNFRKLENIDMQGVNLGDITEPFPELLRLSFLRMENSNISNLSDKAFHFLKNLDTLSINYNSISEVKRSMLPEPADYLRDIHISDNKLTNLPQDFFTGMPVLETVNLSDNEFTTLDSGVFSWVMQNLRRFRMDGNEFNCDCSFLWVVTARYPSEFGTATCTYPEELADKQLMELKSHHLNCWHFNSGTKKVQVKG